MRESLVIWARRLVIAAVVIAALVWVPWAAHRSGGWQRLRRMTRQSQEMAARNAALRAENQRLARENQRLREDPEAAGEVAREELGLIGPGEILIQVEPGRLP